MKTDGKHEEGLFAPYITENGDGFRRDRMDLRNMRFCHCFLLITRFLSYKKFI